MPDVRDSFKLSADGALTVAVRDRYQTAFSGDVTSCTAVVGTAPTGSAATVQVRLDTVVVGTITIPIGATEATADLTDTTFSSGQTFDINITAVGSTVAGSDLDVSVAYTAR